MKKIIQVPLSQDLMPLSVYWREQNIHHRISEESGMQVVFAEDEAFQARIESDYRAYSEGQLNITLTKRPRRQLLPLISAFLASYPVTLILALLSVLGFLVAEFELQNIMDLLVIQGIDESGMPELLNLPERIATEEYLAHGQYWRLLTPIFLHFGWLHIVFNMLWLWELGRRIEVQGGSMHLLSVVFFTGIASNLYQAESTPLAVFGGMSGVVYGLLGYCAAFNWVAPRKNLYLPKEIYILMLASLAIGYSGVFDFLARMANTAHLSGLIFGLIIGMASALITRFWPNSTVS